jgi:glycosyltransferase involved in cell wall biosynthesis
MPDLKLAVAGSGVDRAALMQLAQELGITGQVRFTGQLAPDQMAALVRSADVVLNPVRADNTPNSLLEALASGVPIVSTRVGGIPYLVEHGTTAWLVDPESPEAIAEGLRTVLGDAALRERLVRNGRELAQACSWPRVRDQWLNTYRTARAPA